MFRLVMFYFLYNYFKTIVSKAFNHQIIQLSVIVSLVMPKLNKVCVYNDKFKYAFRSLVLIIVESIH